MILVSVGTNEAPFERLLRGADALAKRGDLVVQHGSGAHRPPGARCVDFLPFDALVEHVRDADLVVTHAGVGSVAVALANGKVPVVVPRRRAFGEAVDDHQVAFARRLAAAGLVLLVEDPAELGQVAAQSDGAPATTAAAVPLVRELAAYLDQVLGPPTG